MILNRYALFFAMVLAVMVAHMSRVVAGEIRPAEDAPQPLSPQESAARMELPAGFRIELVASEPLVADPSCIAFDEHGRFFVCELHGYNVEGHLDAVELNKTGVFDTQVRRVRWETLGGKIAEEAKRNQYGTVKLLRDTDGDGRMDKVDVWADHIPTCYGITPARGGIIVICAPDILYLADRDGDGKAEVRETLYTGFHLEFLERGINNPRWGPDNWIYVGAGGGGGTIRGPKLAEPVEIGHTDFRFQADGSAIEPVHGMVGTFGMTMNDFGDRFPSQGRPCVYALPLPHRYLKRNPYVATPPTKQFAVTYYRAFRIGVPHPWRVKRGEDPAWIKFYGERETDSSYFSGGCGGEIYRAELFPARYRGNIFLCEPSQNIVHREILQRDGSGYTARRAAGEQQSEFLASSDTWFRPINLRVGPDGALYIVDMYREIIEDYSAIPRYLQQQYGIINGDDRGRIWRLFPETPPPREDVKLAELSTAELVRATGDPNAWWRQTAQRVLIERDDRAAVPALAAQAQNGSSPAARLHALYTLDGLGELGPVEVTYALTDPSYGIRMHALQLAERWLASDEELFTEALSLTDDNDPRVRLQLAMTLGETDDPRAAAALLKLARDRGHERWMSSAILSSVHDTAGDMLAEILGTPELTEGARSLVAPLATTVAARRDGSQIASVLAAFSQHDESVQTECLKGLVMGLSRGKESIPESPDGWAGVTRLLGSKSEQVRENAIQLGARLELGDTPLMQAAFDKAAQRALDEERSTEERQKGVEMLAFAAYSTLAQTAAKLLDVRQSPTLQTAAVEALAASPDPRVGATLLEGWKGFTPKVRAAVLDAVFSREDRLPALLDAVEQEAIRPGDINDMRRQQLMKTENQEIATRAETLLDRPGADAELQQRIDRYQKALAGKRNTKRGSEAFAKNCLACHKMKDEGHEVGPALGSVVNKPDEAILLDMLDPSGHIESEYISYLVVTNDGRIVSGILTSDSATSVTLLRDKGAADTILRTDIETMSASDVSLMPSDMHKLISPEDAANLIAYLREAYGAASTTNGGGN